MGPGAAVAVVTAAVLVAVSEGATPAAVKEVFREMRQLAEGSTRPLCRIEGPL